jgi:hypothetical protein
VDIELRVEDVYTHSPVEVRAFGETAFTLTVPGCTVFAVASGFREAVDAVRSVQREGGFEVRAEVVGAFAHLPIGRDVLRYGVAPGVERDEYTIRFFPFASSSLRLTCRIEGGTIIGFGVAPAPGLRLLWDEGTLRDGDGRALPRQHAHSTTGGWRNSLAWLPPDDQPSVVTLALPVRVQQRALTRNVLAPLLTWIASLAAVALAAELGTAEVVAATVGAAWAVILRDWIASERAHQLNLLNAMFVAEAVGTAAWGLALAAGGWVTACVGVLIMLPVIDIARATLRFEYAGRLPRHLAVPWASASRWLEGRRARRRAALDVPAFDHERWHSSTGSTSGTLEQTDRHADSGQGSS